MGGRWYGCWRWYFWGCGGDVLDECWNKDKNEIGTGVRNIKAWGGEKNWWISLERKNDPNDNVLVFDIWRHGVMDLRPQVVVTVGGNVLIGRKKGMSQWILELIERLPVLSLI